MKLNVVDRLTKNGQGGGVQTTPVHLTQTNNKNDKIKINGQLYIFLRIVFFQI